MEQEQIIKRLEWLDEERRKDKNTIASLEERINALQGNLEAAHKEINGLKDELTRTTAYEGRMDQFEADLAQYKVDSGRLVEALDKRLQDREYETEKARRLDVEEINMSIGEIRKGLQPIPDLKKDLKTRAEEDVRILALVNGVQERILEYQHVYEEFQRSQQLYEQTRKQDVKRLTDLQGEITSTRKRIDDLHGKNEISIESFRKLDSRITELMTSEKERRQNQTAFIEKVNLSQVERERSWKEWSARFETLDKQSTELDTKLQALDSAQRAIDRSKQAFDEISQRIERRINEITEMQRLAEDRFRQEWVTYKADDQKRWINYTLVQEETQRDSTRTNDKQAARLNEMEENIQQISDLTAQIKDETEKRLQSLLSLAHDWVGAYERTFSGK
jgi:chromosome segregation ATPase